MRPVVESYAELAAEVLRRPARLGRTRLVAVDGPSGAGKTLFAGRLAAALEAALAAPPGTAPPGTAPPGAAPPGTAPPGAARGEPEALVVNTDDLLDGWADQFAFWHRLDEWVLAPLRAGLPGRYRRYDWNRGQFGDDWIVVPPAPVLVLEGVSSARSVVAAELTLGVFVSAPAELCRARTLARDGAALLPQLEIWRRGERAHFAADRTAERAERVVDGAAVPDPDGTAFVRIR
ncbi:uridine kinase family protein [Plantactinospora sp. WMMC1484]|uniref:uridine kinase family protein n=1 Tax=Plantactinospora sp. WMMC1484 TaxID=3404122 RepID=UPI003BF61C66